MKEISELKFYTVYRFSYQLLEELMTKEKQMLRCCSHFFILFLILSTIAFADTNSRFPIRPNEEITPGHLCERADTIRYPEGIKYCNRDVQSNLKKEIIQEYDARFSYQIEQMDRLEFKIDHFIPLCMGGSNDRENLWPQHKSIYDITDPLEPEMCAKMANGKLLQRDAVELIKKSKRDLSEVPSVLKYIRSL